MKALLLAFLLLLPVSCFSDYIQFLNTTVDEIEIVCHNVKDVEGAINGKYKIKFTKDIVLQNDFKYRFPAYVYVGASVKIKF